MSKLFTTIFLLSYLVSMAGAVTVQQICLHSQQVAAPNNPACACNLDHEQDLSKPSCCDTEESVVSLLDQNCSTLHFSSACCQEIAELQHIESTILTKAIENVTPASELVTVIKTPPTLALFPHFTISHISDPSFRTNMPLLI